MNENELYHYGTLGMRWGDRRYQYKDGSLTDLGRIHYGVGKKRDGKDSTLSLRVGWKPSKSAVKVKRKDAKEAAKKAEELKKKRQEAAKKAAETRKKNKEEAEKKQLSEAEKEKLKEEIIAKGDYKKALDNVELFTNAELKTLVERKTSMNNLEAFKVRDVSKIKKGAMKVTEILNTANNLGSAAIKAHDNIKKIREIINGLDTDSDSKSKKDKDSGQDSSEKKEKKEKENKQDNTPNKSDSKSDNTKNNKTKSDDSNKITNAHGIKGEKWIVKQKSSLVPDSSSPNYEFGKDWTEAILKGFANTNYADVSNYKRW